MRWWVSEARSTGYALEVEWIETVEGRRERRFVIVTNPPAGTHLREG
ncbi:MAG: hypothetical protein SVX38_17130 [Chloroflexota bacterium]|nr:hypothetical protein [Chloroflexota bacterium]